MSAKITSLNCSFTWPGRLLSRSAHFGVALATLGIFLTACGSTSGAASGAGTALTPTQKMALGTLRLEQTAQAIDAPLASQLLPLWQLMAELQSNSSAAPQETAAVLEQIRTTMTADQINAINKMQFAQSDVAAATGAAASVSTGTTVAKGGTQVDLAAASALTGGGLPGGSMPPAGGPMLGRSSAQSTSASKTSGSVAPSLVQQVIDMLETTIQG
jgi:hypothetical protein